MRDWGADCGDGRRGGHRDGGVGVGAGAACRRAGALFQLAPRIERTPPNGLRVIVTRQTAIPKVSITLTVLSGYSSDPADLTGLASLTADLIQEGTKTKSSRQIRRDVFGMGGSLTASASQDFTSVSVRGLSEFAPRLLDLVADVAMNPTIPEDEVAILKQQHLQTVAQQKASPQFVANRTFRRALFGEHPYARTSETEVSLQAMDRAKLVAFHRDHYRPNNAFLLIVGAIDPDAMIAAAEKVFGGWRVGTSRGRHTRQPPAQRTARISSSGRTAFSRHCGGQYRRQRSDPAARADRPRFTAAYQLADCQNIREEKGYTYSPHRASPASATPALPPAADVQRSNRADAD
jgi:predicted Zn-dependent peptidase